MSDEQKSQDKNDGWTMPEPVFRSSDGYRPKSVAGDEDDTLETEVDESEGNDGSTDPDRPPANIVRAAPEVIAKPERGCAKSFLLIMIVMVLAALAVIVAAVYLLFYFKPSEGGTF